MFEMVYSFGLLINIFDKFLWVFWKVLEYNVVVLLLIC